MGTTSDGVKSDVCSTGSAVSSNKHWTLINTELRDRTWWICCHHWCSALWDDYSRIVSSTEAQINMATRRYFENLHSDERNLQYV